MHGFHGTHYTFFACKEGQLCFRHAVKRVLHHDQDITTQTGVASISPVCIDCEEEGRAQWLKDKQ